MNISESKESVREKRARKRASSAVEFNGNQEPKQDLDAGDAEATPDVPNGFLSASVREYLELGRSIPGWYTRRFKYKANINLSRRMLIKQMRIIVSIMKDHNLFTEFNLPESDAITNTTLITPQTWQIKARKLIAITSHCTQDRQY